MAAWWQSITEFADQVADTITNTAIDAEREIATERQRVIHENERNQSSKPTNLPWDGSEEDHHLSKKLMENILELSFSERNFTTEPDIRLVQRAEFDFNKAIPQAMTLLTMDQNLARMHAKISPRMNEEDFWRRYFTRLYFLRYKSGIDHSPPDAFMDSLQETEVVFHDSSTPVTSHPRPDTTAMSSEGDTKTGGDELERDDGVNDSAVAKESGTTQGVIGHAEESAALAAEVEAELGEGDAAGGSSGAAAEEEGEISDDMELLGDEDFEDIGDIDIDDDDAELEAQIARELAGEI